MREGEIWMQTPTESQPHLQEDLRGCSEESMHTTERVSSLTPSFSVSKMILCFLGRVGDSL